MPELSVAVMPTQVSPQPGVGAASRFGLPTAGLVDFAALVSQFRDAAEQDAQSGPLAGEPSAAPPDNVPPADPVPPAGERSTPTWRPDLTLDRDTEPKPVMARAEADDPGDEETLDSDLSDDPVVAVGSGAEAADPSRALPPAPVVDQAPASAAADVVPSQPSATPAPAHVPVPTSASTSGPGSGPGPTASSRLEQRARMLAHDGRGTEPPTEPTASSAATPDQVGHAATTHDEAARAERDRGAASQELPSRSADAPPDTGHRTSVQARKHAPPMDASAPATIPATEARSMIGASVEANPRPRAPADAASHRQPEPIEMSSSPVSPVPTAATDRTTGPDPVMDPKPVSPSPATQIAERVAPALMRVEASGLGAHHLTVRLDPAELGQVEIRIEQAPDVPARVHILVERPETLSLLRQDQSRLEQALDRAGVRGEAREITLDLSPAGTITAQAVAPDRGVAPRADDGFRAPDNPSAQSDPNQSDLNRDPGSDQRPRHGDGRDGGFGDRQARGVPGGVPAAPDDTGQAPRMAARPPADWRRLGLNITA